MDEIKIIDMDFNEYPLISRYGDVLTNKEYVTDPAIARDEEIKKLIMVLLMPEKSGLLIGKAGIGKTAIVEGLAYRINNNQVPEVLKGYKVIKITASSLLGNITVENREEPIINLFIKELERMNKTIVFIDEIHTLIGAKQNGPMDLANMLKTCLDRGTVKAIGATTTAEYEAYVVRDRAFLRRFERIDVLEPDQKTTVEILLKSVPRIEKQTGVKFNYTTYLQQLLIESIVSATSEYKRIYGLAAMYPDVAFSVLMGAFSQALYQNKKEVTIDDVYNAIKTSKRIYPDTIVKELELFRTKFESECQKQNIILPVVELSDIEEQE